MAESIQDTLLNQIRIVSSSQKVVIWISNSIYVVADIDGVKPASPGRLEYLTEVAIKAPIPNEKRKKTKSIHDKWNINQFFKYIKLPSLTSEITLKQYEKFNELLVVRIFNLKTLNGFININKNIFNVYAPRNMLPLELMEKQANNFFTLCPIHLPSESGYFDETIVNQKDIVVQLCPLVNCGIKNQLFIPLYIDDVIFKYYKLIVGARVILYPNAVIENPTKIEILTDTYNSEKAKEQFKLMIAQNSTEDGMLLNSDFVFHTPNNYKMMLKFTPSNFSACVVSSDFIRSGEISVSKLELSETGNVFEQKKETKDVCLDIANLRAILQGCMECSNLGTMTYGKLENVLLIGKAGTGKTTIAKVFAEKISAEPHFFHVEIIKCKNIKGKSLDSLHKLFTNTFLKLIYYQPSLLILDDINVICEKVIEGDVATQESLLFNRISEMLVDLLEQYLENNMIMLLVTAESTSKLNQHLFMSRGNHLFKNIFSIDDLNKNDRKTFLSCVFSKYTCGHINVDLLSVKTEGLVIQDLVDFVDKCAFESYKDDNPLINADHCLNALSSSSSLSLKNVKLHLPGERDFSDIGGLDDVKKILVESMMWPAQYPNIFGSSPLRLQSGLLLYGPPGTGKTILAEAAAKQCGLRLISIKGPELLSKYIGASEQAVRDVFQKAQSAKPCILFFDEFDSLAPRRGHDNTGVTDRVVNQFLTQLDGVESLTGVCVLASTSRPDLLDPALLRPGRLDRQLLCPLPTKDQRLSILRVLSKNVHLAKDVNFEKIASETEGYSGADLQGILYTAQLTSMEDLLSEAEIETTASESYVEIDQHQLEEAVRNTRPSLTREERLKYDMIYAKFQGKFDVDDIRGGKQKATLA